MRTPKKTSHGRRWFALGSAVVVAAAAFTFFAAVRDDGPRLEAVDSQRVAATQRACEGWLDDADRNGRATPHSDWCMDLGHWMRDQLAAPAGMGSRMWDGSESLAGACQRWVDSDPSTPPTTPTEWCGQMVTWMTDHMTDWNGLDDWDHHMGDGHWMPNR